MPEISLLHLITELSTGGAQYALLRLLEGMDRERYQVQVACLYNGDAEVALRIRALGIQVTDLGMTGKWRVDALLRLYSLLRRQQPDILHTWLFHANFSGRLAGRLAGVRRIISSERTMEMEGRVRRSLNRMTSSLADRIICVSQRVAEFAAQEIGLPADKLVVIPNGISLDGFSAVDQAGARRSFNFPRDDQIIGTVSRAERVKGLDVLLDAFKILHANMPELLLAIAGDGPELPGLKDQAQQSGLGKNVHFLGEVKDIPKFLAALDVFALSSYHEGMPNAVLEAMAAGLPVAATAAGGTLEVITDQVTGFLVPPGDRPGLARVLTILLDDPSLARRMGRLGRQRVEREFNLAETVRRTCLLYEELVQSRERPLPKGNA
jgi:glycosyltransferase involved in cell wall biosynthesis